MRILVVGGGGREHALAWALKRDTPEATLFVAPGNPGTAQLGTNLNIAGTAVDDIVAAVKEHRIDLTVVGPEAPLALGLADRLRASGRPVFGPSAQAARIESSKAFAKALMRAADVPTAPSQTFADLAPALAYIRTHAEPLVVKASGLAGGKGAVVCSSRDEAAQTARAMLIEEAYGEAGREIVVEEYLEGEEVSVLALTDGEQILTLPPIQDHKRLGEGDTGPNTGGMGAYCPVTLASSEVLQRVRREVLIPTIQAMASRGTPYTGVLYAGLMLTSTGTPYVLEFNCRLGDPEAQAVLPVLPKGATEHIGSIATDRWNPKENNVLPDGAAVATVLAARGYPASPELGGEIDLPSNWEPQTLVFHSGTQLGQDGVLRVGGGRVLSVTGLGETVPEAARRSAEACARVSYEGKTYRRDIAWREMARARAP